MNGMVEKTHLGVNSAEFANIEYLAQLNLQASTARVLNAYALSNPHVASQFERRAKDLLCLDSWMDVSFLSNPNNEDTVIKYGFRFDNQLTGMTFPVGKINFVQKSQEKFQHQRKYFLCKIAIGRAFVCDEEKSKLMKIPEGYQSLYISKTKGHSEDHQNQPEKEEYYHEYFIKEPDQILPLYLVDIEFNPEVEMKSREKPICDNCEHHEAAVYCKADEANLCRDCDHSLHSTNKLASRHTRTPVGESSDVFGCCPAHQKKVEFFCSYCHIPVCVYCKMVGHHSSGEASKHKLVSVVEAYQTVLAESKMEDSVLQSQKHAISNQLSCIDTRRKAVEKHGLELEAKLEQIYQKALTELRDIVKLKLDVLQGDEIELKRQVGEILRLEEFLKYQQDGNPTQFLFSWSRHQNLCAELHEFKHFRNKIDVHCDIQCNGSITITTEENEMLTYPPPPSSLLHRQMPPRGLRTSSSLSHVEPFHHQRRTSDFFAETLGALQDMSGAGVTEYAEDYGEYDTDSSQD